MSNAQTRASSGAVTADSLNFTTPGAVSFATKLILGGFFPPPDKGSLGSKVYYDRTIGEIDLYPLPDRSGIQVTVTPTFPDVYLGVYCVLRGRYEYKNHPDDASVEIVYEQSSAIATEIVFTDTDIEPGVWYYYTVIAAIAIDGGPDHFGFNPNTGMAAGFRYKDKGHADKFYARLPNQFRSQDPDLFTQNYVKIFGYLLDTLFTDIETYILGAKDLTNVEENQLERLAAYVGWPITREVNEIVTRQEIASSRTLYSQKGRNNSVEFNIQLISGWEVEFEAGEPRVLMSNTEGHESFDPTNLYLVSHIGDPIRLQSDELVGTSNGAASQVFALIRTAALNITISVCDLTGACTNWTEVTDFTGAGPTDQVYTVTEDPITFINTITFGDGALGEIPTSGYSIRARYQYGGDRAHYSAASTDSWEHSTGFRLILEETGGSRPLTTPLLSKVAKIVENLAPSYAIYKITIASDNSELYAGFEDSFTDTIETLEFITMNVDADHMNDDNTVMG